jgi:hypothetical protein
MSHAATIGRSVRGRNGDFSRRKVAHTRAFAAVALGLVVTAGWPARAETVLVANADELAGAIAHAQPGQRIALAPGDYTLGRTTITRNGTPDQPIVLAAAIRGTAHIHSHVIEMFKLYASDWVFEGLDIIGDAGTDHAFHIVADADRTVIRNNRLRNFNAAIKANPEHGKLPDRVLIENNVFYNDSVRETRAPVTPMDIVGGDHWVIRQNFIADFGSNKITYGAFLKGGSTNGIIERNLVVCEWKTKGGIRVGLSFGGGGTMPGAIYRTAEGEEEHGGIIRNNVIANCPNAEAIYLNKAGGSKIYNNTIYNAYGIQARFPATPTEIRNNVISGAITARTGAQLIADNNLATGHAIGDYIPGATRKLEQRISDYDSKFPGLFSRGNILWAQRQIRAVGGWLGEGPLGRGVSSFRDWFVAPQLLDFDPLSIDRIAGRGRALPEVTDDFCGQKRAGTTVDLGAIEYSAGRCAATKWAETILKAFE